MTRELWWGDTGLSPGESRELSPLLLMAIFQWRITCSVGIWQPKLAFIFEMSPMYESERCSGYKVVRVCGGLNVSLRFSF